MPAHQTLVTSVTSAGFIAKPTEPITIKANLFEIKIGFIFLYIKALSNEDNGR